MQTEETGSCDKASVMQATLEDNHNTVVWYYN